MLRSLLSFAKGGNGNGNSYIFPTVDPKDDGPDCKRDCADCTVNYPSKLKIETSIPLYGHLKPFDMHILVATGKSDWTQKPTNEKGSLPEALSSAPTKSNHGKITVLASDLKPHEQELDEVNNNPTDATTVLILPSFTYVDSVTPNNASEVIDRFVNAPQDQTVANGDSASQLTSRPCPHDYVILLCSHKRRDARCGLTAPLLKKELERQLRPLGLYRDADDMRPGGVGIHFVSHVGGHKFAANVLVYRKKEQQMIWLARVRPEHCEGIVKYTLLQGKVVHPESQLRGGFDRARGLTSW